MVLFQPITVRAAVNLLSNPDFESWIKANSFTEKHAGRRTLSPEVFRGPNKVESFELILDSHSAE